MATLISIWLTLTYGTYCKRNITDRCIEWDNELEHRPLDCHSNEILFSIYIRWRTCIENVVNKLFPLSPVLWPSFCLSSVMYLSDSFKEEKYKKKKMNNSAQRHCVWVEVLDNERINVIRARYLVQGSYKMCTNTNTGTWNLYRKVALWE